MVAMFACALVALTGFSLTKLHNTSFRSLLSSEATMQAQHYAKTKMDYLVFCGYNSLAAQGKTAINDTTYKDAVVLGTVATDSNGVSRRTVTVNVYNEDENVPRATLSQVFYSNDANRFVVNGSSTANAISLHYDSSKDKLFAKVDGNEKSLGGIIPAGTILPWYGDKSAVPTGFVLCDGANGTPDLRNKFLVGAGSGYSLGNTGGNNSVIIQKENLPSDGLDAFGYSCVGHYCTYGQGNFGTYSGEYTANPSKDGSNGWQDYFYYTAFSSILSNNWKGEALENRSPYFAVYYIMKL